MMKLLNILNLMLLGAWVGDETPIFITRKTPQEIDEWEE